MKLSICIPVYNGADTVAELVSELQKVFAKTNFEIVMANDGSHDNSSKVCKELTEKYSNIRFINLDRKSVV